MTTKVEKINSDMEDNLYFINKEGISCFKKNNKDQYKMMGFIDPSTFLSSIPNIKPVSIGIMDKNTIFYSETDKLKIVGLEFNPQIVRISYIADSSKISHYNLSLPYMQIVCCFQHNDHKIVATLSTHISCSSRPIKYMGDKIYRPPMSNIYRHENDIQNICFGGVTVDIPKIDQDNIFKIPRYIYDAFINSNFSIDLTPQSHRAFEESGRTSAKEFYRRWEDESKKDPMFGTKMIGKSVGTFDELINRIRDRYATY